MSAGPTAPAARLRTPDFDSYPCDQAVIGTNVVSPTTVEIRWSDGRVDRHHPWTLRENATDPTTTSPVTRERLTDIATWADDVAVMEIVVDANGLGLTIRWAPDDLVAAYDAGWLRHLGDRSWHPDAVRPPVELWNASADEPPTFDGPAYLINDDTLSDALRTLAGRGLRRVDEIRLANTLRFLPDMDHNDVDRAYRSVRRFSRLCDSAEFRITFPFQPGDCVIFDNRRVLHGREAFADQAGERHLRGCYVDRDDLYSRLRMLARSGRHQAFGA